MSQDVIASPQNGSASEGDATAQANFNDAHLVVLLGQTVSSDDVRLTLANLNASFTQIGKSINEHLADIVNAIRHKQFEKSSYDQQQRIGYSNDVDFTFELLVNPLVRSVRQSLKNVATSARKHRFVVNLSGDRASQGDLNCADASFACDDLLALLADPAELSDEQRKALKHPQANAPKLTLVMPQRVIDANRAWKHALEKQYPGVSVQPITAASTENVQLNEVVSQLLNQTPIEQLLTSPKRTGTLKVTRPTLYIFPSQQGDSAYFALNGYSMLVNGGYDRLKPAFWKFVNMLEQIDSVLITHADADALGGLSSFFARKVVEPELKPSVLTVLGNLVPHGHRHANQAANLLAAEIANNNNSSSSQTPTRTDSDIITEALERLKIKLSPLVKTNENLLVPFNTKLAGNNKFEHINLYSKLGHGSLDLFVLSPYVNSPEHKEFYAQQQQAFARHSSAGLQKAHLAVHGVFKQLPFSHLASAVCLLVWLPAAPGNALRLLFTGNAPQHVILHALDKLKDMELLAEPVYRVKSEPTPHHHQPVLKKQTSLASGVKEKEPATNGRLNTSISSKPVGTANGGTPHHDEPTASTKAKPPVPTQSSGKPQQAASKPAAKAAPTSTSSTLNASTAASGATKDSKDSGSVAAPTAAKKPPTQAPTNSNAAASKKKSLAGEHVDYKTEKEKPAQQSGEKEKPEKKKLPPVPKKETSASTNGGGPVKPSQSETSTAATSGSSSGPRSSMSSHTVSNPAAAAAAPKADKPECKPPVPKQQPHPPKQAPTGSKPAAGDNKSHEKSEKPPASKPETGGSKKQQQQKQASAPSKKTSTGGPKALTLSVGSNEGASLKGGAPSAPSAVAAATTAAVAAAAAAPVVEASHQQPASVESIETPMHHEETPEQREHHEPHADVVVQHVEQVEQIEKMEQVVNVEQVIEEIVPATVSATSAPVEELYQQPAHENGTSHQDHLEQPETNHFAHGSPNLSPVKKEFGALNNSSSHVHEEITSESAAATTGGNAPAHEVEPVVEEQLTSEAVTTAEIEIVSGNLNGDAAAEPLLRAAAADDDVMTRSFIEDADNPGSNPFAAPPVLKPTNGETNGHGNGHLNESCDLNRTHELFDGDESSSSINTQPLQPTPANGNGDIDDKLIGEFESLKLAAQPTAVDSPFKGLTDSTLDAPPNTWNLLELPPPVNPTDNLVDLAHVDVAQSSDKMEIDAKPGATSSPAGPGGPSSALSGGADNKKAQLTNGKGKSGRASVDASKSNAASSGAANAKPARQAAIHPAYVELSYIPAHGSESHVDAEFFKRVRARHYVLSALEPSEHVLNALCDGKEVWEDKQLQVTLIPTYESEALRKWYLNNEERLNRLKIDVSPAACHATITMEDNPELTCQVYKLEF